MNLSVSDINDKAASENASTDHTNENAMKSQQFSNDKLGKDDANNEKEIKR